MNTETLHVLKRVLQYVSEEKSYNSSPLQHQKPDISFVEQLRSPTWLKAIRRVSLQEDGSVEVEYRKPKFPGETTVRVYDAEAFFLQLVLLSFGGGTGIDPKGTSGGHFYPRLDIRKRAPEGRPMVWRLLSDTPPNSLTTEPESYHDLRLASYVGRYEVDLQRRPDRGQTGARVGRDQAKAALLANYDDASKAPPESNAGKAAAAITRDELSALVEDLFVLLDRHHPGKR